LANWQYCSDEILESAGFYPARLDVHRPSPPDLISLAPRQPIHFIPSLQPWNTAGSYQIYIQPEIPGVHKCDPPETQLCITEAALSHKRKQCDFSFWTDGSVLNNGYASAACISFPTDGNPCKKIHLNHEITTLVCPVGYKDASCAAEKVALVLPTEIMLRDPEKYAHANLFVGSDSQSSLMAMSAGPLRDFDHSYSGYDWSQLFHSYVSTANDLDSHIYAHWIPAHVGILPNEEVNNIAGDYAHNFPHDIQSDVPIHLKAIKSTLKRHVKQNWIAHTDHHGPRYQICGLQQSHLSNRCSDPPIP